ncbi:hypothetical protein [Micromonospora sp. NPDC007230]|uniref:hypothetical protein n=1 Tax=Micromonospora sp. NPDC007230 TaxID=3364237 RepID=UPI0036965616
MTDHRLLVGAVDRRRSFEQIVELVARVTGAAVREVPGERQSVVGTLPTGYVRVLRQRDDRQPQASGTYVVDLELEDRSREPALMNEVFSALVADGYRVVLVAGRRQDPD